MYNIKEHSNKDIKISLVGNKRDLTREVTENEALEYAKANKIKYYDCSAKESIGFGDCVVELAAEILKVGLTEVNPNIDLNKKENVKSTCSC